MDPGDPHWNTEVTVQTPGTGICIPPVAAPTGYQTFPPRNSQLLLLFFLVAEEEEGWRIFGLWQLLWQSSPARTSSLWCSTPPGSAGEGSCSSHSCGYTESPGKAAVSSQQTISTATSKPKKQRIHYRDTKRMVFMCFTIAEGCRHEEGDVAVQ